MRPRRQIPTGKRSTTVCPTAGAPTRHRKMVAPEATDPEGPPLLVVPSLINRAYVLDLAEGGSMMRWLATVGVRPLLLDWGWPGEVERSFTLTDYIAGRLERALGATPRRVVLAGYCMGGLLALAAALRRPERIRATLQISWPPAVEVLCFATGPAP